MSTALAPPGYDAARESAAFFHVTDGGRFRLLGPEAQDFLHRMVTNDIRSLTPGQGAYAAILDINGRMLADLWAWLLDTDNILIEAAADVQDSLMAALDRYIIMEQVEIEDARESLALVTVQGPHAQEMLRQALKTDVPVLEPGGAWEATAGATDLILAARDRTGQGGLDIYIPTAATEWLLSALLSAGAAEASPEAMHVLRVEAGIAKWGSELTEQVIPLEAGLEGKALSFTKGCYPGQEIIARIHSRGKPAKHLVGIRFAGDPPPAGVDVAHEGRSVGKITSSALSPVLGGLAMGYLKKESGEPGVEVSAGGVAGITSDLPFGKDQ